MIASPIIRSAPSQCLRNTSLPTAFPAYHHPSYRLSYLQRNLNSEASKRSSKPQLGASSKIDTSHPRFSLKDLGATRTVRVTVLVVLSILGTLETIFYAKMLRVKMGWGVEEGRGDMEEEGDERLE